MLRKEYRTTLALPVRVSGMDSNGSLFKQEAGTLDVTTTGARLTGMRHLLHRGCVVTVQHGASKARFRVMWVGGDGGPSHGQIGIQLIESGKFIWGQVLPRILGDQFRKHDQDLASCLPQIPLRAALRADPGSSQ